MAIEPIYFSDSGGSVSMSPEAAARYVARLSHPDFRYKALIPGMAEAAHLPFTNRKSFATNTIIGMAGLTYAACELMEFGYGIFSGYTDDEFLMTWLSPMMLFQRERLVFKIFNWTDYLKNTGARGSSPTWACAVGTYSDIPVKGCELNYCFDQDRHSKYGVPAGVRPSDVTEPCLTQPVINIVGTRITDRVQLREFNLMMGTRLMMLDKVFDGSYCASPTGNNGEEDGVLKFFDNFAVRHDYLAQDCLTALAPNTDNAPTTAAALSAALGMTIADTPAAIAVGKVEWVVRTVSQHIIDVEYKVAEIAGGGAVVDFGQIGVMMNPVDAQCFQWYQFCQAKCETVSFTASSFTELNSWYRDFQARLHGGLYGGGVLRLHDGREISIMPLRRIPQGTVLVLVKGWSGNQPNPYGLRLAAMQYNDWYSEVQRTVPNASMLYKLILNGTGVRVEPIDACGVIENRWNSRLFSNAPWMQLKITGLPACADVSIPTWPTMPTMTSYSRCVPPGCE